MFVFRCSNLWCQRYENQSNLNTAKGSRTSMLRNTWSLCTQWERNRQTLSFTHPTCCWIKTYKMAKITNLAWLSRRLVTAVLILSPTVLRHKEQTWIKMPLHYQRYLHPIRTIIPVTFGESVLYETGNYILSVTLFWLVPYPRPSSPISDWFPSPGLLHHLFLIGSLPQTFFITHLWFVSYPRWKQAYWPNWVFLQGKGKTARKVCLSIRDYIRNQPWYCRFVKQKPVRVGLVWDYIRSQPG